MCDKSGTQGYRIPIGSDSTYVVLTTTDNYADNMECSFGLYGQLDGLEIIVEYYNTENCCDIITITDPNDGYQGYSNPQVKLAGISSGPLTYRARDYAYIRFTSDGSVTGRGFRILVRCVCIQCFCCKGLSVSCKNIVPMIFLIVGACNSDK